MEKYKVEGMTCAACVAHVEKAVKKVEGVNEVTVSLLTNSMEIDGDVNEAEICKAVEDAGYHAYKKGSNLNSDSQSSSSQIGYGIQADIRDDFKDTTTPKLKKRLFLSVLFLLPLMYFSMGHMMFGFSLPYFMIDNHIAIGITQMLLAIIVMFINRNFFISGLKSTMHGTPNMDTLVAMGSGISFIYSVIVLYGMTYYVSISEKYKAAKLMDNLYFESAAMILTLITIGKTLESYSKGRTTDAIKGLIELIPQKATVIKDGKEIIIDASDVKKDDIFLVRPAEKIPVDGIIISGESAIDESALTGESIPVDKGSGAEVSVGTINISGVIKCKAIRVGQDTSLSKMIEMVSQSAASKAPIAKIADKVAGIFTPVVLVIALITAFVWLFWLQADVGTALTHAITVLVISCPCALGLATPVAIMVGNGIGAKTQILYKTATALETVGRATTVILDKTGTITEGKPKVTNCILNTNMSMNFSKEDLLQIAFLLEKDSKHPLAQAIVNYCQTKENKGCVKDESHLITEYEEMSGSGIRARINGVMYYATKGEYVKKHIVDSKKYEDFILQNNVDELLLMGKTPLFFSREDEILGVILVSDTVKEDSARAINGLKKMGLKVVMLTGDNAKTAEYIAKTAEVDEVISDVMPIQKADVVKEYKHSGEVVVMVGDGINDALALTEADVGLAIGAGTDIAIEAADVVLVNSSLSDVVSAIQLSKKVISNIHENLFWAFIYNIIGIPLAAGVWIGITGWTLTPMFGAAAMSLSSFCVCMNALRLNLVTKKLFSSQKNNKQTLETNITQEISEKAQETNITQNNYEKNKEKEGIRQMTKTFKVEGMMCHNCENHVKKALEKIDGVESVVASHEKGTVEVTLTKEVDDNTLCEAIKEEGYTPLN
ncbi:heavy metal translocating P-type ATPase [Lachnobacterium bovis]|uniref:heavy metal translocating P-type ATPase n=1 Tax=Lachnobacterium bovis TaxID=140626 RepID=UPI00048220CD|nr:heavy metal translocating P-type ATPase [Lachnobacterium bovis]